MPTNTNTVNVLRKPVYLVVMECGPIFPTEKDGGEGETEDERAPRFQPEDGGSGGDGTQGGKQYPGTLRNLVKVPRLDHEDGDDEEYREEEEEEEEGEDWLPTDRPQFVGGEVGR